jgi:hypothetical protein
MARTTVTLDPDVEALLAQVMRERGVGFKAALNEALRRGLTTRTGPRVDYAFPTYDLGAPRVDLTHALRVAADLEDDEIARELTVGR